MLESKRYVVVSIKSTGEGNTFEGDLSTYGNVDSYGDVCEPGCFDDSIKLKGSKFPLLWQHNASEPIGHLIVESTEPTLKIKGDINLDVARGKEAYSLLKRGDIQGLSIGYVPVDYYYDDDGIRRLLKLDLKEGSVVTFPANELAAVAAVKKGGRMARKRFGKLATALKLSDEETDEVIAELEEYIDEVIAEVLDEEKRKKSKEEESEPEDEKIEEEDEDLKAMKSAFSEVNRLYKRAKI